MKLHRNSFLAVGWNQMVVMVVISVDMPHISVSTLSTMISLSFSRCFFVIRAIQFRWIGGILSLSLSRLVGAKPPPPTPPPDKSENLTAEVISLLRFMFVWLSLPTPLTCFLWLIWPCERKPIWCIHPPHRQGVSSLSDWNNVWGREQHNNIAPIYAGNNGRWNMSTEILFHKW